MSLFSELKRRNVVRAAVAYAVFAWLLLQVVDFTLDIIGSPNWIMQTLVALAALGLPCVMAFAWVFEITPEGIKRDSEVPREQSIRSQTGYRLGRLTLVAAVVLVIFLVTNQNRNMLDDSELAGNKETVAPEQVKDAAVAGDETAQPDSSSPANPEQNGYSIAVLPFVNMSSDPEQEYFSDGISEEILNVLSRIPQFKIAARTSSFQFKGQNQDISKIAEQLNVNHVLEGSVRKSGDKLRITAQLINAESGYHLWSETYDRELNDVFAIQDEISAAIAAQLETQLIGPALATAQAVDLQAYELYLKGRGLLASRQADKLAEAIDGLKQAIKIAPDYAPAMSTLAMAYAVLPYFSDLIPAGESRGQARIWAEKALIENPDSDEAMSALSIVLGEYDLDPGGALVLLNQALKLNPNSVTVNNILGDVYTRIGDLENALKYESRAAELDPLGPVQWTDLGNVYYLLGDYAKVLEVCEQALQLDPGFPNAFSHMISVHYVLGDIDGLKTTVKKVEMSGFRGPFYESVKTLLNHAMGNKQEVQTFLQQLLVAAEQGLVTLGYAAMDAAAVGDFDTAGRLLILADERHDGTWTMPIIIISPEQAPESEPWQAFWRLPGPNRIAQKRKENGLGLHPVGFGEARQ